MTLLHAIITYTLLHMLAFHIVIIIIISFILYYTLEGHNSC